MCRILGVSRSGYYKSQASGHSPRKQANTVLAPQIKEIFEESRQTYGIMRIQAILRSKGLHIGKNRISRLMRESGCNVKSRRKFKATTYSKHTRPVSPNILQQKFSVTTPNTVWTGDVTYVQTGEGWLYLAVVLDLYSRMVVGWSMSERQTDELVISALQSALWRRKPTGEVTFHSDRGSQYCSRDFKALIARYEIRQSMSATGCCYDNAVTETLFHTLKTEHIYHCVYKTRDQARTSIFSYLEEFYNRKRIHSTLGYLSPSDFESMKEKYCG